MEHPIAFFNKEARGRDGYRSTCKSCDKATKQLWYVKNREVSLVRSKVYRKNNPEWAKEVDAKHHRNYNWREKFPEKAKLLSIRQAQEKRFRNHGITKSDYDAMLFSQKGVCAVCGETPVTSAVRAGANKYDNFVIDHDHETGIIRGIVCTNCNVALGMIRDDPKKARKLALYLEKFISRLNCGSEVQTDVEGLSSKVFENLTNNSQEGEITYGFNSRAGRGGQMRPLP